MNAKRWLYKIPMPNGDFVFVGRMHNDHSLYKQKRDGTKGQKLFILWLCYDTTKSTKQAH